MLDDEICGIGCVGEDDAKEEGEDKGDDDVVILSTHSLQKE